MGKKEVRFGKNLKILRNKNRYSQKEIAEEVSVERQTISAWENSVSSPNIDYFANMCELFNVSADELLFGKMAEILMKNEIIDELMEEYTFEFSIRDNITKKGYYDITDDDLETFYPIKRFDFSRIVGIATELKERGYNIISVYANGFGIYLRSDEEAKEFSNVLYHIIDAEKHGEKESIYVRIASDIQSKLWEIELNVLNDINKSIYGKSLDDMYYWIDELDQIRGFANTEAECKKQAEEQGCVKYTILHE